MKKTMMSLAMMMLAATMALPAFAAQKDANPQKHIMVAQNSSQPCCPNAYETQAHSPQRDQTRRQAPAIVDPGQTELPWAALRY